MNSLGEQGIKGDQKIQVLASTLKQFFFSILVVSPFFKLLGPSLCRVNPPTPFPTPCMNPQGNKALEVINKIEVVVSNTLKLT